MSGVVMGVSVKGEGHGKLTITTHGGKRAKASEGVPLIIFNHE